MKSALKQKSDMKAESKKEDGIRAADAADEVKFTQKQLIRKLHIVEPVENVMCVIGKRYPATLDKFYQARLPGTFDESKSGKRMKLPIPETWETQLALRGNKAGTWQDLVDHHKLPFKRSHFATRS